MKTLTAFLLLSTFATGLDFPAGVYPGAERVASTVHRDVKGLHSHWCEACKIEWWHSAGELGKRESHICPRCKAEVWDVHAEAPAEPVKQPTAKPASVPVLQSVNNCPNGYCPLPTRKGKRQR